MNEARREEPFRVDLEDTVVPASGERGVIFDESHRCGDRSLVRSEDLCGYRLVGECPQHRDALRRRERESETRDSTLVVGVEAAAERGAVAGIGPVPEESFERHGVGLMASDPERLRASAGELARTLGTFREVVLICSGDPRPDLGTLFFLHNQGRTSGRVR